MMRTYLTRPGARQASDDGGECMYEGVIGGEVHRCAIGCVLSPTALSEVALIEGSGVKELRRYRGSVLGLRRDYSVASSELAGVDPGFLDQAQTIHDNSLNWNNGKFSVSPLDWLATQYGLTVVVDEPVGAPRREVVIA